MFRFAISLLVSLAIDVVALTAAFFFCFDMTIDAEVARLWRCSLPMVLLVKATVFTTYGEWQRTHGDSLIADLTRILSTTTLGSAILATATIANLLENGPSLLVIAFDYGLTILLTAILRAAIRIEAALPRTSRTPSQARRALIYCADRRSVERVDTMIASPTAFEIVAILSHSSASEGLVTSTMPIVRIAKGLSSAARRYRANQLLISDEIPGSTVRKLSRDAVAAGMNVRVIANSDEIEVGRASAKLRDVTISDFYRAERLRSLTSQVSDLIAEKTVLITGAAGTIGAECCRQILRLHPKLLIMVDRSESGMRQLEQELKSRNRTDVHLVYSVSDVNDQVTLGRIFGQYLPDVVFHAAGHHDSSLMAKNIQSAIRNNVLATRTIVDLTDRFGIEHFVLISTHKAFHPIEAVGATAVIAERYVQAMATTSKTHFHTIRIGNALGSAGCPSQVLETQLAEGGPLMVSNPNMSVMSSTIPDLVRAILQACVIGQSGQLLALAPGPAIPIRELANDMLFLSRRHDTADIDTIDSSDPARDELLADPFAHAASTLQLIFDGIYTVERDPVAPRTLKQELQQLERASLGDAREASHAIQSLVAEFANEDFPSSAHQVVSLSKVFARNAA